MMCSEQQVLCFIASPYLDVFVFFYVLSIDTKTTSNQVNFQLFNFDCQNNFDSLRIASWTVIIFQFNVSTDRKWGKS